MRLPRFVGLADLGVVTVVAVALFLPNREMYAGPAFKGDDAKTFALALAEAKTIARPQDGAAIEELSRQLGEVGFKDWAIEAALIGSDRGKGSPTRWRALLATSVAFVDRLDVKEALDYANMSLSECESSRASGAAGACPSWEEVRMKLYQQHLDAGVKSGIDPRRDPMGFRRAGESALRSIRLKTNVPPSPSNSGSAGTASGSGGK